MQVTAALAARAVIAALATATATAAASVACGSPAGGPGDATGRAPLRLWHTFGPAETEILNADVAALRRGGRAADATLVPFGMMSSRLGHVLGEGRECPDLARIDATWLPQLAESGHLAPVPAELASELESFLPEARELARWGDAEWGIPQTVDGLALIYDGATLARLPAWPPRDLAALEAAARALTDAPAGRFGLSLRSDGYWFVAWLRASGADVLDPAAGTLGVDTPAAEAALAAYARLAAPGGVAPPPSPAADEAALEAERFAAGEVAVVVGGPWTVAALEGAAQRRGRTLALAVAPFPRAPDGRAAAPRGGQIWVVPRCAARPAEAFRLALALTDPARQAAWSRALGVVPTRKAALAEASRFARAFADALAATRPLPRHPLTPRIFDDLTPAIQAVMAGDATAAEAMPGVIAAWKRLLRKSAAGSGSGSGSGNGSGDGSGSGDGGPP